MNQDDTGNDQNTRQGEGGREGHENATIHKLTHLVGCDHWSRRKQQRHTAKRRNRSTFTSPLPVPLYTPRLGCPSMACHHAHAPFSRGGPPPILPFGKRAPASLPPPPPLWWMSLSLWL